MNFLIILIIIFASSSAFAHENDYEEVLVTEALKQNLNQNETWLNMLYYEKDFGGFNSIIDSKNFFISKDGKTDPKSELIATLHSFFISDPVAFKSPYENPQASRCAFPGRYLFLKEKLKIDENKLPKTLCNDLEKWYNQLAPKSVTLIFASSYLNNPASMFGHTFLLIDSNKTTTISSQSLNYSADTAETSGLAFAYKGVFGIYQGKFSLIPYHQMIKKYSNMENRDLWEYPLDLSEKELRIILYNIWELGVNYADYYFFSENCSYLLLKLLQIVRPEIKNDKKLFNWIIPSETVKEIAEVKSLIKSKKFRPSRASKIKTMIANSDLQMQKITKEIIKDKELETSEKIYLKNLDENDKKIIYELSYEYQQYDYSRQKTRNRNNMAKTALKILNERSKLSNDTKLKEMPLPNNDPILGHDTLRLNASLGYEKDNHEFVEMGIRPGYHELLDNSPGFLEGSQIQFLEGSARYYSEKNELEFNHFSIVDIKSHSPRDAFFKPISWELNVGPKAVYVDNHDYKLFNFFNFYPGLNYKISQLNSDITFLFGPDLYYSNSTSNPITPSYSFSVSSLTEYKNLITQINLKNHNLINSNFDYTEFEIKQNFSLNKNLSLRFEFLYRNFKNYHNDNEIKLGINRYF